MKAIVLTLLTKVLSTNYGAIEVSREDIILIETNKQFFQVSKSTLSSILQTHINGRELLVENDDCVELKIIQDFFGREIEIFVALVSYYELMCKTSDVESDKIQNLAAYDNDITNFVKDYRNSYKKVFKDRHKGAYCGIGQSILENYKGHIEKQLKTETHRAENENLQNKLGNLASIEDAMQLRTVANLIKWVYEYSVEERAKFSANYSGIDLKIDAEQIKIIEGIITSNQQLHVNGISIASRLWTLQVKGRWERYWRYGPDTPFKCLLYITATCFYCITCLPAIYIWARIRSLLGFQ